MVLSDYDETGQWAPGVYEEKLAEHNKEKALKDKQEADYKKSWSAENWTKAMVAMISLDEGAWTALASGTVDDFLMDSTKTTPEEFALQVSMLAVIVIAGKAGEIRGAKSGRATAQESVTTAEIYEQARAEGIDLPTDNAFELRINELTREFNAQTPAAKRATIQNGLDIRLSEAQTRFDSADTPLLKSQRKLKLDEANTLKNKFLGDYAKSDEGLAKAKGKADDYSGSGMLFETESSGSYTKGKAFKPSELKEMESEGLLARQRAKAAEEVAKAAKARADARQSTSEKIEKQKQELETFGKKARDTEKEKPPLKTSEIEDGLDDALDPNQENPTPTPEEPIDIFLKNNPQATESEISNFKAKSPEVQKSINDFRAKYTPEQIARGLEATRKAREARIKADKAIEDAKNNPEEVEQDDEPSETTPLIDRDEPELTEDPKPPNTKVYPEDNPLLDKLEAQGYELTQAEIDMLRDDFGFDYENELNPAEPTETTTDPTDLLDYDEEDVELTAEEKKELLDKYGFDFDNEINPAEPTETTVDPDPRDLLDDDERERDETNPVGNTDRVEENTNNDRDNKGPTTGKKGPSVKETAAAAALIIGQAKAGEVDNANTPEGGGGTTPSGGGGAGKGGEVGQDGDQFSLKNIMDTKNIDELLRQSLRTSEIAYDTDLVGETTPEPLYNLTLPYSPNLIINYLPFANRDATMNIVFNQQGGTLYVGFRGTANEGNLFTDLLDKYMRLGDIELFREITDLTKETDIIVHAGFAQGLASIYMKVRDEIDKYRKIPNVVFTGHSLGGALATLMNFVYEHDITNKKDKIPVLYTVTFGSPRFLIDEEVNIRNYDETCPNVIRVFNTRDPIPYFPSYLDNSIKISAYKTPFIFLAGKLNYVNDLFTNRRNRQIEQERDIAQNAREIFEATSRLTVARYSQEIVMNLLNKLNEAITETQDVFNEGLDMIEDPELYSLSPVLEDDIDFEYVESYTKVFLEETAKQKEDLDKLIVRRDILFIEIQDAEQANTNAENNANLLNENKIYWNSILNTIGSISKTLGTILLPVTNQLPSSLTELMSLAMEGEPKNLIHIGQPLNLDGTINFNNINNLVEIIGREGKSILKEIEYAMRPTEIQRNELFKLITSKEFRINLLASTLKCTVYNKQIEALPALRGSKDQSKILAKFVLENIREIKNYNDKCKVLEPLKLDEFFKVQKMSNDPFIQNFYLSTLSGVAFALAGGLTKEESLMPYHTLEIYNNNLDRVIEREVQLQKSFFISARVDRNDEDIPMAEVISDFQSGGDTAAMNDKVKSSNLIDINNTGNNFTDEEDRGYEYPQEEVEEQKIIAIYIGDYNNYDFIEY